MVGWSLVLMDRSFYEIRYTYLKSIEPNFFIMRKINIIVSQTTLCSCRSLSLFIQDQVLVYHFCMGEKFGVVKAVVYGVFDEGGTENGELTLLAATPLQLTDGGIGEY